MAVKKSTAISDEEIISALLSHGTIAAAAEAAGIAPRTLYDRMAEKDFQVAYSAAKSDLLRTALLAANRRLNTAIDTVACIMENEENNPATRLQAAQTIISTTAKFAARLEAQEEKTTEAETDIGLYFHNLFK